MSNLSIRTIAIVVNTSWNVYNFRLGLLKALQVEGYRIIVIAPRDEYSLKFEELEFEYYDIRINNKGTNPFEDIKLIRDFYRLYRKTKPDILLHYTIKPNIYGTIAAKLAGIPVISNISGLGTVFLNKGFSSMIAQKLYRFVLRFPKKIFFQNPYDRAMFIEKKLASIRQADLVPGSGIDTQRYRPVELQKDISEPFVFLLIARMLKDKGVVEFVRAAQEIKNTTHGKNVEFWLLGSIYLNNPTAVDKEEIEEWEKDGIIKYLGHTDNVREVIIKADCIVLPSYREGLSRVLLEAASMAKPIITTDTPGCKDIVDDGINGYLCKVKDSKSLAEQIKKMLQLSKKERSEMGERSRKKVIKEFDEIIVIDKYREVIVELYSEMT